MFRSSSVSAPTIETDCGTSTSGVCALVPARVTGLVCPATGPVPSSMRPSTTSSSSSASDPGAPSPAVARSSGAVCAAAPIGSAITAATNEATHVRRHVTLAEGSAGGVMSAFPYESKET